MTPLSGFPRESWEFGPNSESVFLIPLKHKLLVFLFMDLTHVISEEEELSLLSLPGRSWALP